MKKASLAIGSLLAAVVLAAPARAQRSEASPLSLEVRGGVAFPRGEFATDDGDDAGGLETGLTYGANLTFQFIPLLGIYGGYTQSTFGVDGEDDAEVIDRGFSAGLRLAIPTPLIPIDPYVKAGVLYNQLRLNTSEGTTRTGIRSDRGLGFEAGAGLAIGLGSRLSITPQVTYSRYTASFDRLGTEGEVELDVEHIRVDVGLRLRR